MHKYSKLLEALRTKIKINIRLTLLLELSSYSAPSNRGAVRSSVKIPSCLEKVTT